MRGLIQILVFVLLCGCSRSPVEKQVIPEQEIKSEKQAVRKEAPNLFKTFDLVMGRFKKGGYEKLSQPEKVFLCVWKLEAEVNNGGFIQYYFNNAGDHAQYTADALKAIGADHTASLVKQANELFGAAGPPSDRINRQNKLMALGADKEKRLNELTTEFLKYKDKLGELLEDYVSKNPEAFRSK